MNACIHPDRKSGTVPRMREWSRKTMQYTGLIDEAASKLDTDAGLQPLQELAPMLYDDRMWIHRGEQQERST